MSEEENVFAALEERAAAWGIPLNVRKLSLNEYRAGIEVGDAVIVYAPIRRRKLVSDGADDHQTGVEVWQHPRH